jgi:alkaline phosphatase D
MARHRPDLFLFVGDTVYTDHRCSLGSHVPGADYVAKTLAEFHGKHRYNRADPALQEFFRSTSVFAIWDDHEVRNNFAGPTEPLMPVGLQALLDYWPIEGPAHDPRRLYRAIRWGRHLDIFVLDTRQYRSDQSETDGPAKTMLGSAQREWLLRALAASDATWKLVVTSVPLGQFTGGRYSDSWSNANLFGYPRATAGGYVYERDTILRFVRDRAIRNVVFVSGDVHHAELSATSRRRASSCTSSSRAHSRRGWGTRASSTDRSTRAPSVRSGSRRTSARSSSTGRPCKCGSSTRRTRYARRCGSCPTRR